MNRDAGRTLEQRAEQVLTQHRASTGADTVRIFQAPGRVNLLGEHTDYSGGFCMPAALSFNTIVAATPRSDGKLRVTSLDFSETAEFELAHLEKPARGHWSAYCAGVAWSLRESGVPVTAAELTIAGNVPLNSGLSSSASIEVATATALLALAHTAMHKPQVALACQRAENDFVGAPCGIMDQYISACGVKGNALAIDTRALTAELAPIPEDLRLVVCNSMVTHSVGGGEYGTRRREVEEAAHALHVRNPAIVQLRDATIEELDAAREEMSHEAFLRGRHVITDSQRVLDGLAALRAGDPARFGTLMTEAHASFRDDFAASCRECDLLVEIAITLAGCLGSRLTGGGFGGCTVSLVRSEAAETFATELARRYEAETKVQPQVFICEIADGAGEVELKS